MQPNELADSAGATFTLENGQTYPIPQFQIITPIYHQRAPNNASANLNPQNNNILNQANGSNEELNQQADINKAASASATANAAVTANVVDVVPSKKRQHDAIEQDFIPLNAANLYQSTTIPVKRPALTDSKTGLPVFQPFAANSHHPNAAALQHLHAQPQHLTIAQHPATVLNYSNYPINLAMQYSPYPQAFSLPYNGHAAGMPRL